MNTIIDLNESEVIGSDFVYCQFEDMPKKELKHEIAITLGDMNMDTINGDDSAADYNYIKKVGIKKFMKASGFKLVKNDIVRPLSEYK